MANISFSPTNMHYTWYKLHNFFFNLPEVLIAKQSINNWDMDPWRCQRCVPGCAFLKDLEITDPPWLTCPSQFPSHSLFSSPFSQVKEVHHPPPDVPQAPHHLRHSALDFPIFFPRYLPGEGLDFYHEIPKIKIGWGKSPEWQSSPCWDTPNCRVFAI